jgi:hypothetical protein
MPCNRGSYQCEAGCCDWLIQKIDDIGEITQASVSLILDANDRPHISYFDNQNKYLKYATFDGNSWDIQIVDPSEMVGYFNSIGVDKTGRPHIAYFDLPNHDLKYAYLTETGWEIEVADSEGNVGNNISLSLDSNDVPHISYQGKNEAYVGFLKYATKTDTTWNIQVIDTEGDIYNTTSMQLDRNDRPHISYFVLDGRGMLKYAYLTPTGWSYMYVDQGTGQRLAGVKNALLLDNNDTPWIAYVTDDIFYKDFLTIAVFDGSEWQRTIVDPDCKSAPAMKLDASGGLHLCYHDHPLDDLIYAHKKQDLQDYYFSVINTDTQVLESTALALDSDQKPHIVYYSREESGCELKYAQQ